MSRNYHTPLFLDEIRDLLGKHVVKVLIDATFAEGGHGLTYAKEGYTVLGIEYDRELYERTREKLSDAHVPCTLVLGNFADLDIHVKTSGLKRIDAILFDFGISMFHIRASNRGFSMEGGQMLDLRADSKAPFTGADIITSFTKEELYEHCAQNIESIDTRRLVDIIIGKRIKKAIQTTGDLWEIAAVYSSSKQIQESIVRGLLQVLRRVVNNEELNMKNGLEKASALLGKNGLVITITFHSLEDRLVKLFFKNSQWLPVFKKPHINRSCAYAKSARLRAYVKQ